MSLETPAAGLTARPAAGTNPRSVAWMDDALCAQIGPDDWFSESGNVMTAQRICARCPVQVQCGAHVTALEAESPGSRRFGVWAGLSGGARKAAEERGTCNAARDARILSLKADGWNASQIAESVGCDERTVYRVLLRDREAS